MELNIKPESKIFFLIKTTLNFKDTDPCYVISYDENEGKEIEFKTAFEKCEAIGFAGLIIGSDGSKYYLKTEQVIGPPKRFFGSK